SGGRLLGADHPARREPPVGRGRLFPEGGGGRRGGELDGILVRQLGATRFIGVDTRAVLAPRLEGGQASGLHAPFRDQPLDMGNVDTAPVAAAAARGPALPAGVLVDAL